MQIDRLLSHSLDLQIAHEYRYQRNLGPLSLQP